MEENKNLQPEQEVSPEEKLDQLLAEFLAAPDLELPPVAETSEPEPTPEENMESQEPENESVLSAEEPAEDPIMTEASDPELEAAAPVAEDATPAEDLDILPMLELEEDSALLSFLLTEQEPAAPAEDSASATEAEPAPITEAEPVIESSEEPEAAAETADDAEAAEANAEPESAVEEQIIPLSDVTIGESLATPSEEEEIGVDEQALEAAGLTTVEPESVDVNGDYPEEPTSSIPILISTHTQENPETKEPESMSDPIAVQHPDETSLEEEDISRLPKKKRPIKKGTYGLFSLPHMAATVIWLSIILFVGVGLGNILWEYAADMLAFGREENNVAITIYAEDDLDAIAEKLKATGLIKYPGLFKVYAGLADAMEEINPGTYKLKTTFDYNALVDAMSGYGARVSTKVVIPEGYTCKQIFQLLEQKGVCTVAELESAAATGELSEYWFLEGLERGSADCLEGYLFPDTYEFYLNESATSVLNRFLRNFNRRFSDAMKENLIILNETLSEMMRKNGMSEAYIAEHQMTVREVVIIASMIEKETANTAESYTIASVIYNRLTNPNAYPYLQIDATLVYVTGNHNLTMEDLALDNPYNTYKYPGLVPGPISNPSRASLDAALDPLVTAYYYYALNPDTGEHKFSETAAEHDAFLESLKKNEG